MTKCENSRPKPGELAFRKGDMVTILEACEVRGELEGRWCALGVAGQTPPRAPSLHLFPSCTGQELVPCQAPQQRAGRAAGGCRSATAGGPVHRPQAEPHAVSGTLGSGVRAPATHPCLTQHRPLTSPQVVSWQDLWSGSCPAAAAARGRAVSCEGVRSSPWRLRAMRQFRP